MVDGLALIGTARAFEAGAGGEVEFAADQRLDALGLGLVVELDRAVEIAVVREGQRLHPEGVGPVHQAVDPAGAIQQGVVAMDVKMDEIGVGSRQGSRWEASVIGPASRKA